MTDEKKSQIMGFLFQEILAHWGECVDENTGFQALK